MVVGVHGEIEWRAANRKKGEQNTEPGVEQVTADDLLWIHKVIEQKDEKMQQKDKVIEQKNEEMQLKDKVIAQKDEQMKNEEIEEDKKQIAALQARLQQLLPSEGLPPS